VAAGFWPPVWSITAPIVAASPANVQRFPRGRPRAGLVPTPFALVRGGKTMIM